MFLKMDANAGHAQDGRAARVYRRQSGLSHSTEGIIVFAVVAGFFLCGGLILAFVLRYLRIRHANPKYVPGAWLKARWRAWIPSPEKKRYSSSLQDRRSIQMARTPSPGGLELLANGQWSTTNATSDTANAVDRNTSVRSTITLPSYSAHARPTETIMGREGERAGIDTVVEFPETVDEEEARREEEMESLYQIRRARREERTAREERRRLRREARARGDTAAVEALRAQSQSARHGEAGAADADAARPSAALIQDHQTRDRGRRVPAVSYSDLGVARHDGSRVRANSNESDRPLLDAAASFGGANENRPRSASSNTLRPYFQNASTTSLRRFMTPDYSDDDAESDLERASTPRRSSTPTQSRLASREGGDGETQSDPPQYDNLNDVPSALREPGRAATRLPQEQAPPYESPIRSTAPRLPAFSSLPAIEITPTTPWSPVARDS